MNCDRNLWEVGISQTVIEPNTGEEIILHEKKLIPALIHIHAHEIFSYVVKGKPHSLIVTSIKNLGLIPN